MYRLTLPTQTLTMQGITYSPEELTAPEATQNPLFDSELIHFLQNWFSPAPTISLQTSGSTGIPKTVTARKEQLMQSACMTCSFLNLQPGDKALLCMPLSYIAGKMVVVRALVAGLDLWTVSPSGHPLAETKTVFQFAAMIPLQVYNSLQIPAEKEQIQKIEKLIIGGGGIDSKLSDALNDFPNQVYSTYGMTETLSHIAVRRLNGKEATPFYTPFPAVTLSLSPDETLIINAPLVNDEQLITNDIAHILPDGRFEIRGRKDNVINSGGIKIQIEVVENTLRSVISTNFVITSLPHPKFGEIVVLLLEAPAVINEVQTSIEKVLSPYELPKKIVIIPAIPLTTSGKINRAAVKRLAEEIEQNCPSRL